jgi:hypothetical protein
VDGNLPDRLRARWRGLGGKLGMGFATAGFLLIVFAWNGAAGIDYVQGQLPYLISGGVAGLGLIVLGAALLIIESNRRDRVAVEQRLEELAASLRVGALGAAGNGNGEQRAPTDGGGSSPAGGRRTRRAPLQAK